MPSDLRWSINIYRFRGQYGAFYGWHGILMCACCAIDLANFLPKWRECHRPMAMAIFEIVGLLFDLAIDIQRCVSLLDAISTRTSRRLPQMSGSASRLMPVSRFYVVQKCRLTITIHPKSDKIQRKSEEDGWLGLHFTRANSWLARIK